MCIHVRAMSHGKPSTKAAAPAKATVQCSSIHDDGIFNVVAAVTSDAYEDVCAQHSSSPCQHASSPAGPAIHRFHHASEMLITATEAFCPAPRWWKFTRFLPAPTVIPWWPWAHRLPKNLRRVAMSCWYTVASPGTPAQEAAYPGPQISAAWYLPVASKATEHVWKLHTCVYNSLYRCVYDYKCACVGAYNTYLLYWGKTQKIGKKQT